MAGEVDGLMGRTAVITGGAGEIGQGLARAFATLGMGIALVDVDSLALEAAEDSLKSLGADVLIFAEDVSDSVAVDRLATSVCDSFGEPAIVCANAGVIGQFAEMWLQAPANIEWVLNVNVRGTANLIRAFVPRMLAAGDRSHFVITGSDASFTSRPFLGPYHASKHALLAMAETLAFECELAEAPIRVHLLSPGGVRAPRLLAEDRNRLAPRGLEGSLSGDSAKGRLLYNAYRAGSSAMNGDDVAAAVVAGISADEFYIFPDENVREGVNEWAHQVTTGLSPELDERYRSLVR